MSMELFDTNQYITGTAYDFELNSSEKKGKQPIYDPAWEDGSAFPGIEDKAERWEVGSRISAPNGGTIEKVLRGKYVIRWDNGFDAEYTSKQIKSYGYQIEPKPESDSPGETLQERPNDDDRWNPDHFDPSPAHKADGNQLTIFLETGTEPPEPDDFKTVAEYEEAWKQWETLSRLTCAVVLASGSPLPESKQEVFNSLDLQKSTITAQTSSVKDTQESPTMCRSQQ